MYGKGAVGAIMPQDVEPTQSIRIAVGSERRAKVEAVAQAAALLWPRAEVVAVAVSSGVPAQPVGLAQTRRGAAARARQARDAAGAAVGFGLESGIVWRGATPWVVNVVVARDASGRTGWAEGPRFPLPRALAARLREGMTLAEAVHAWRDGAFQRERGVVHLLTDGAVERAELWLAAVALAASPLRHPDWYAEDGVAAPEGRTRT